ncbi:hypothetical protein J4Q44_G00207910 [Coregonus suidteri]|uniref:Uncharacterized protein n=1 Tax=Coregonus suidteri TaxID=861788 RepID=A0AAN8LC12_9TELE
MPFQKVNVIDTVICNVPMFLLSYPCQPADEIQKSFTNPIKAKHLPNLQKVTVSAGDKQRGIAEEGCCSFLLILFLPRKKQKER